MHYESNWQRIRPIELLTLFFSNVCNWTYLNTNGLTNDSKYNLNVFSRDINRNDKQYRTYNCKVRPQTLQLYCLSVRLLTIQQEKTKITL